jgi:uridylate kinase
MSADAILKATKVDGVYDDDPATNPEAKRYKTLSFQDALTKRLGILDSTAFSLCMDNHKPIIVFDMTVPGNITRALTGEPIGTLVGEQTQYASAS